MGGLDGLIRSVIPIICPKCGHQAMFLLTRSEGASSRGIDWYDVKEKYLCHVCGYEEVKESQYYDDEY